MLRTASSLPLAGLLTLGFDPTRFQMKPPACYRATWQLPEPDSHRQATTSLRTANHLQRQPPAPLDARKIEANAGGDRANDRVVARNRQQDLGLFCQPRLDPDRRQERADTRTRAVGPAIS